MVYGSLCAYLYSLEIIIPYCTVDNQGIHFFRPHPRFLLSPKPLPFQPLHTISNPGPHIHKLHTQPSTDQLIASSNARSGFILVDDATQLTSRIDERHKEIIHKENRRIIRVTSISEMTPER